MEIVDDDDGREGSFRQRPGGLAFQVRLDDLGSGLADEVANGPGVPVHHRHGVTECEEVSGVAPTSTGEVENRAAFPDQRREAANPGGRLGDSKVERMRGNGPSIRHFSTDFVQTLLLGAFAH
jgi:hypothetical protein